VENNCHRGRTGLNMHLSTFGVAAKQKTNARLAFDKSANQAGFFPNGPERLIEPILGMSLPIDRSRAATIEDDDNFREGPAERSATQDSSLHPFIQGLLDTLPEPQTIGL